MSVAVINNLVNQQPVPPMKEFNRLFLVKLSLPIANKFVPDRGLCDENKTVTLDNCSSEKLIRQIVAEPEFVLFQLDSPKYSRVRKL